MGYNWQQFTIPKCVFDLLTALTEFVNDENLRRADEFVKKHGRSPRERK